MSFINFLKTFSWLSVYKPFVQFENNSRIFPLVNSDGGKNSEVKWDTTKKNMGLIGSVVDVQTETKRHVFFNLNHI